MGRSHHLSLAFVLASLAIPSSQSSAQTVEARLPLAAGEVRVEIVAVGVDRSPATKVVLTGTLVTRGDTITAARAANVALFDKVITAVRAVGGKVNDVRIIPPTRTMGFIGNEAFDPSVFGDEGVEPAAIPALAAARKPVVSNTIEVRIPNAALYEKIRDALELAGAKSVSPPVYSLLDDAPARRAAKADAVRNAQNDARAYADALGMRIERIIRITEAGDSGNFGGMMQTAYQQMWQAFGGTNDAVLGEVRTTQAVSVEFVLLPK